MYSAGYIRLLLPNEVLGRLSIDLVVRGEAEPVIEEIINRHRDGAEFKDILSCSYRDNGNIVHKPIAPLIDINILPDVPYHLFDSKVYDMGFVISSRGVRIIAYSAVSAQSMAINIVTGQPRR